MDVLYVKHWVCVMCLKANWSKDGFLLWLRVSSTWCSHQKAASFKHETTFTIDKKRRKFYITITIQGRILRASSTFRVASERARRSGGNRERSLFIPLLAHASPCACHPHLTSRNCLKWRACSQATQDAMPRSHHIKRVKREKQTSALNKQSFDITKAG